MAVRKNSRASLVPAVVGGSIRMSAEALTAPAEGENGANVDYEYIEPVNACGCFVSTVKWRIAIPFTLLFLIFESIFIGVGTAASSLMALALVSLVVACVGCNILCCPCCQPAKGADE